MRHILHAHDRYEAAIRLERIRHLMRLLGRIGWPITVQHAHEIREAQAEYQAATDAVADE